MKSQSDTGAIMAILEICIDYEQQRCPKCHTGLPDTVLEMETMVCPCGFTFSRNKFMNYVQLIEAICKSYKKATKNGKKILDGRFAREVERRCLSRHVDPASGEALCRRDNDVCDISECFIWDFFLKKGG